MSQSLEDRRNAQVREQEERELADVEARRQEALEDQAERERAAKYDLWRVIQESPADFPLEPASWNVLIEMYEPKATMGRFQKTQAQIEAEAYLTVVGRVLKCGVTAFAGKTSSGIICAELTDHVQSPEELAGKYVIIQRYTGNDIYFAPFPAKKLRFITLQEVLAVTTVPSMFMKQ